MRAGGRTLRISHPGAAALNEAQAFNRTDGPQPLHREVMFVTLSGRLRRQKEWYRKIVAFNDPVSLLEKRRDLIFTP